MLYSIKQNISKGIIWIIALLYLYGAIVHLMNILGLMGFDWLKAPLKWQILDISYLILDITVAIGFFLKWRVAFICFYIATISQLFLYTIFKSWIIDVPKEFTLSSDQLSGLNTLVIFHLITIILISVIQATNYKSSSSIK